MQLYLCRKPGPLHPISLHTRQSWPVCPSLAKHCIHTPPDTTCTNNTTISLSSYARLGERFCPVLVSMPTVCSSRIPGLSRWGHTCGMSHVMSTSCHGSGQEGSGSPLFSGRFRLWICMSIYDVIWYVIGPESGLVLFVVSEWRLEPECDRWPGQTLI